MQLLQWVYAKKMLFLKECTRYNKYIENMFSTSFERKARKGSGTLVFDPTSPRREASLLNLAEVLYFGLFFV